MKKAIKTLLTVLIISILLAGIGLGLLYFKIVKTPAFVSYIPVFSDWLIPEEENIPPEENVLVKIKKENDQLRNTITNNEDLIIKLQNQISDMESEYENSQKNVEILKTEVAKLNDQIISLKTAVSNKKSAYKDMAGYFTEMKSADAADIISRLKDEDIIGIFNEMPQDLVAEMLQKMDRNKAIILTEKMLVTE